MEATTVTDLLPACLVQFLIRLLEVRYHGSPGASAPALAADSPPDLSRKTLLPGLTALKSGSDPSCW